MKKIWLISIVLFLSVLIVGAYELTKFGIDLSEESLSFQGSDTNLYDSSINGFNGTITGATFNTSGKFEDAISFDATDDITINDDTKLDLTENFTIEAWIKPNDIDPGGASYVIVDKLYGGAGNTRAWQFGIGYPDVGDLFLGVSNDSGVSTTIIDTENTPIVAETWQHVAATFSGTNVTLYVDGVAKYSEELSGTINTNNEEVTIGKTGYTAADYFPGEIDEVRITNDTLTSFDITNPLVVTDDTIALWHFDDLNVTRYLNVSENIFITSSMMTINNTNETISWMEVGTKDGTREWDSLEGIQPSSSLFTDIYAYWNMNSDNVSNSDSYYAVNDSTYNNRDLNITALEEAKRDVDGKVDQGIFFNYTSTSDFDVGIYDEPGDAFPYKNISVGLWIKTNGTATGNALWSYTDGGVDKMHLVFGANGELVFDVVATGGGDAGTFLSDNIWYFIVTNWDSATGNVTIYKDGVANFSKTMATGDNIGTGGCFVIGQEQDGDCEGFEEAGSLNGTVDEFFIYNRTLAPEEIVELYNEGEGMSLYDEEVLGGFGNITTAINDYLADCTYVGGICRVPFYFHSDGIGKINYSDLQFNNTEIIENVQTFNSSTTSTSIEKFLINISYDKTLYPTITSYFVYDNVSYLGSLESSTGNEAVYSKSITIPTDKTSYDFLWDFRLTNSTGQDNLRNSSTKTQTVGTTHITFCEGNNATDVMALNFSFADEVNDTTHQGKFKGTFYVGLNPDSLLTNFSIDSSTTPVNAQGVCVPISNTIYANADIEYSQSGYDVRNYFLRKAALDSNTNNITLYMLEIALASGVTFHVSDEIDNPYVDVIVKIQRKDEGTGNFKLVAMGKTDMDGETYIYVRKFDAYHKIVIDQSGTEIHTTDETQINEDDIYIRITDTLGSDIMGVYQNMIYSLTHDNTTNIFTLTFSDPTGLANSVCLDVKQLKRGVQNGICDKCLTSSSGTITCEHPDDEGTYTASMYIKINPNMFISALTFTIYTELSELFGLDGVWAAAILFGTVAFAGLFNPVAAIVLSIAGLIFSTVMGLAMISVAAIGGIIIVGIILILKMKN